MAAGLSPHRPRCFGASIRPIAQAPAQCAHRVASLSPKADRHAPHPPNPDSLTRPRCG
ncbi:hypothetical protein BSLA_01r3350 [Burkholderia stabilis]|nr:hypothetical protein BSLA_01r3350 [Burkholderia stabilis]